MSEFIDTPYSLVLQSINSYDDIFTTEIIALQVHGNHQLLEQ